MNILYRSIYFNDLGLVLVLTLSVTLGRSPLSSTVPQLEARGTESPFPTYEDAVRTTLRLGRKTPLYVKHCAHIKHHHFVVKGILVDNHIYHKLSLNVVFYCI